MGVETAEQVVNRQNEEISRLRQELQRYQQAQGVQGGPAANPDAVPLPSDPPTPESFRMKEAILRSVPKFLDDGKVLWRDHKASLIKFVACRKEYITSDSLKKTVVLESLGGRAVTRITGDPVIEAVYETANYQDFCQAVKEVFQPDSERTLIGTEFQAYGQERTQDVQSYLSNKLSLFKLAYPPAERSFDTLLLHCIKGLLNNAVRRQVRRANPRTEEALRSAVVEATAAERDAFHGGYSESASADGLVTISSVRKSMVEEGTSDYNTQTPMEVDSLENPARCFRCHRTGYRKADCHAKKTQDGKEIIERGRTRKPSGSRNREADAKKKKRCFNCNKPGHLARECRSPKKSQRDSQANVITEEDFEDFYEEVAVNFLGKGALRWQGPPRQCQLWGN